MLMRTYGEGPIIGLNDGWISIGEPVNVAIEQLEGEKDGGVTETQYHCVSALRLGRWLARRTERNRPMLQGHETSLLFPQAVGQSDCFDLEVEIHHSQSLDLLEAPRTRLQASAVGVGWHSCPRMGRCMSIVNWPPVLRSRKECFSVAALDDCRDKRYLRREK